MPSAPTPLTAAHRRNLARLCLLRGILTLALLAAAALAAALEGLPLWRDRGLTLALGLFAAFNLWTLWRLRRREQVGEAELFGQLVVDVLLVTLVLYRTGGSTNPFVSYYLVPITIAAATLRMGFSVTLALLTLSAYTLLLYLHLPFAPFAGVTPALDLVAVAPSGPHHHLTAEVEGGGFNLHIFGMWLNFLLSAGLITFFVSRMSVALREQDRHLAAQRERLLRREQVVALGALAAGAAHELGTPLATMSVIARDIETELPADSHLREEMAVLRQQLALCRATLQGLRRQAAGEVERQPLSTLLNDAVARVALLHPAKAFTVRPAETERSVRLPPALPQILINLLDNAARAAGREVIVRLLCTAEECVIAIDDDGSGVPPAVADRLGQPFVSDQDDGLGLGYFLSHASVNEWGGSVRLMVRNGGGTTTRLALPWPLLAPQPPLSMLEVAACAS